MWKRDNLKRLEAYWLQIAININAANTQFGLKHKAAELHIDASLAGLNVFRNHYFYATPAALRINKAMTYSTDMLSLGDWIIWISDFRFQISDSWFSIISQSYGH